MEPVTTQIIIASAFGVTFVAALIILAIKFPDPTPFQYNIFRIVLSLAASGVATTIPGFINIEVNPTTGFLIRAGGAIAVFVIVFFFNPAQLIKAPRGGGNKPPVNKINLSIPGGWSFEEAARSIANVASAAISFEGFEPEQLTQKLRSTEINTTDIREALLQLRYQATGLPAYQVYFEKGVYHIHV